MELINTCGTKRLLLPGRHFFCACTVDTGRSELVGRWQQQAASDCPHQATDPAAISPPLLRTHVITPASSLECTQGTNNLRPALFFAPLLSADYRHNMHRLGTMHAYGSLTSRLAWLTRLYPISYLLPRRFSATSQATNARDRQPPVKSTLLPPSTAGPHHLIPDPSWFAQEDQQRPGSRHPNLLPHAGAHER